MTRNNRLLVVIAMVGLFLLLLVPWGDPWRDVNPHWFSVPFLLLFGLFYFIASLNIGTVLLLELCLLPGAFCFYHLYCGIPFAGALDLLARCLCILALTIAVYQFLRPLAKSFLRTSLQLLVVLGLPVLSAVFLLKQNLLFLILLPLSVGLFTYFRDRRAKND